MAAGGVRTAELRAVAVRWVTGDELLAAVKALTRRAIDLAPTSTVGVERGRAVRTHDLQILETVVVADAVDVVEDQRHLITTPLLPLTTELARTFLQPRLVQPSFELPTVVVGSLDENLRERSGSIRRTPAQRPVRIHVSGRDAVVRDVAPQRPVVVAARDKS
jgi:hypothetical protein